MTQSGQGPQWPEQPDPRQYRPEQSQPPYQSSGGQYGQQPPGQQGYQGGYNPPQQAGSQPQYQQPYGQPHYQQQGQYPSGQQPNQYGQQQGQYGQQPNQYGQQPYAQQGAQGYYQQTPPTGPGGYQTDAPAQPGPARKSKLPVIITAAVVVLALVAGGLIFLLGRGSDTAGGASTPKEAVTKLLNSLSESDPIGVADQLDPAERSLFQDVQGQILDELKRLEIINDSVKPDELTGVTITADDVTYAGSPIAINDHIQIMEVTGGTITIETHRGPSPFTDKIRNAIPEIDQGLEDQTQTIDLAEELADTPDQALRIATVQRDGTWFPSLFYTIADNAAYQELGAGYMLAPIGNRGGASPEDTMNALLDAALAGDAEGLISVLDPQTMAVLHDYGSLITDETGGLAEEGRSIGVSITDATWTVSDVKGGKKVSLGTLELDTPDGHVSIVRDVDAESLTVMVPGQPKVVIDPDSLENIIQDNVGNAFGGLGSGSGEIPPEVMDIIKREYSQVLNLGVVMVKADDGKWYVSPLRSVTDVVISLLKGLQPQDIDYFISLAKGGN